MTTELTAVARGSACELAVTSVRSTISSGAFAGTWISATIRVAVRPGITPVSTRPSESESPSGARVAASSRVTVHPWPDEAASSTVSGNPPVFCAVIGT